MEFGFTVALPVGNHRVMIAKIHQPFAREFLSVYLRRQLRREAMQLRGAPVFVPGRLGADDRKHANQENQFGFHMANQKNYYGRKRRYLSLSQFERLSKNAKSLAVLA